MANKQTKKSKLKERDPFDLDDDLNFPEDDFDIKEPKDDRKPSAKIVGTVKEAAKDTFKDAGFLRKLLREAMPPVYGEVEDIGKEVIGGTKELYNTAVKEIKPTISALARATDRLIPETNKTTKGALDRIKKWSDDNAKTYAAEDKDAINEKNISLSLADVFKFQMQEGVKKDSEDKAEGKVQESLNLIRHRDQQTMFGSMSNSLSRLTQYQERITAAYQKKSLELQYRSYFVLAESLKESKSSNELQKANLELIAKNTALPEYVKLRESERIKQFAREKIAESLYSNTESLFSNTKKFIGGTFGNIKKKGIETIGNVKDSLEMGADMVDMSADMREMMDYGGEGTSAKEMIAKFGISKFIEFMALKGAQKIRKTIDKNEKISNFAKDTKYFIDNLPNKVSAFANNQNYDDNFALAAGKNALASVLPGSSADLRLNSDNQENGLTASMFTQHTNKSITEIIPGYLARIFRELQVMRTGDESVELTKYDISANSFTTAKLLKNKLMKNLVTDSNRKGHSDRVDQVMNLVDPENTLSPVERKALASKLIEGMFTNEDKSPQALSNQGTYHSNKDTAGIAEKLADLFTKFFTSNGTDTEYNSTEYKTKRNRLDSKIMDLKDSFVNPAQELQKQFNFGNYETVRDTGLMDDNNSNIIDYKKLINEYNKTPEINSNNNPIGNVAGLTGGMNIKDLSNSITDTVKTLFVKNIDKATITITSANYTNASDSKSANEKSRGVQETIKNNIKDDELEKLTNLMIDNSNFFKEFLKTSPIANVTVLTKIITDHGNEIKTMHKEIDKEYLNPIKEATIKTSDTLTRIEEFLINKLKIYTSVGSSSSSRDNDNDDSFFGNVKKTLSATTKLAQSTLTGILKLTKPGMDILKSAVGVGKGIFEKGLKGAKISTRFLADRLIKIRDIYVEGETYPRLTKVGITAGKYRDSLTGKVIRHIDDLKTVTGDIIDENGDIVLKHLEIAKTFVKRIDGSGILEIGKSLFTKGTNLLSSGIAAPIKAFNYAKTKIIGFLDRPVDVYLKNSDTPVLLAVIMKAGGYISKTTGAVITKMSQIDGPVMDLEGNYVITLEQLKGGLFDKYGKPIVGPYSKIIRATIGAAALGIRTLIKAGSKIASGVFKTFDKATEFGSGLLTGLMDTINLGLGGKKSLDVLIQVRDILDSRLPKSNKVKGDNDGDGDRDGSWKDLGTSSLKHTVGADKFKRRESKQDDKKDPKNTPGLIESLIGGLSSLKDAIFSVLGFLGMGKMMGGRGGGGFDLPGGGKGKVGGPSARAGRRVGRMGKLARAGEAARGIGGFAARNSGKLLKGAGLAGAAYGAYSAYENVKEGNYGEAALDAGMTGLGIATTFGGLSGAAAFGSSVLGGAAAVGGALITGTAALLSSPVVLGALAVAAVGYGSYKLYKWLSSPNMEPLSKMRMGQYGFTSDDTDQIKKVQAFEKLMLEYVKYDDNGKASFIDKDLELKEILGFFDIQYDAKTSKDEKNKNNWLIWFKNRFKPVFLNSLTALKAVSKDGDLLTVDKLEPDIKLKYIKLARFEEGPYDILVSPFPDIKSLNGGAKLVGFFYDEALKKITEQNDKKSKDKKSDNLDSEKSKDKDSNKGTVAGIAATVSASLSVQKVASSIFSDSNINAVKKMGILGTIAAGGMTAMKIVGEKIGTYIGYNVQALEAVRFKAYGLKEMDRSKVMGLRKLEENMSKGMSSQADGAAVWSGVALDIFYKSCGDFGLTADTSDDLKTWNEWFNNRFMPVYTKYFALLKQATGKDTQEAAEKALADENAFDIAKQLAGMNGIWSKATSPWIGYELNTDSSSTKENVQLLNDKAEAKKLSEEKANKEAKKKQAEADLIKQKGTLSLNDTPKKSTEPEKAPPVPSAKIPASSSQTNETKKEEGTRQDTGPVNPESGAANNFYIDKQGNKKLLPTMNGLIGANVPQGQNTQTNTTAPVNNNPGAVGAAKGVVDGNASGNEILTGKKSRRRGTKSFEGFGSDVDGYIKEASEKYGIPEDALRGFVKMEDGWTGKMSTTGAIGVGQFIQSTWNNLAKTKEGKEIGMTPIDSSNFRKDNDPRHDKRINTLATGLLAKQNADILKKKGVDPTGENLYMVHNIGPGVIPAMKGEPVNESTLTAMRHNGMTSKMSAEDFVKYQKDRFNTQLASANGVSYKVPDKIDDYADKSKLPGAENKNVASNTTTKNTETIANKGPAIKNTESTENIVKVSLGSRARNAMQSSAPVRDGYAGSINATRPDQYKEQSANNALRNAIMPSPGADGFRFNQTRKELPQETNRDIRIAIDSNGDLLSRSLDVQTQILSTLSEISGKIDPKALASMVSSMGSQNQGNSQQAPAPDPQKPNSYKSNINEQTPNPSVPVSMRRGTV